MTIFGKPLSQVTESDLNGLIANKANESITLEFKQEMYAPGDTGNREMLRDICSLANADGGVLIIGMEEQEEDKGRAKRLRPIPQPETQSQRIISSCLSSISERVPGLRTYIVRVANGSVCLVDIPRSYRKPHMVTVDGKTEFWVRRDRQKSPMSITEIRTALRATEDLAMRAERFIEERLRVLKERTSDVHMVLTGTPFLLEEGRISMRDSGLVELLRNPPSYRRPDISRVLSSSDARIRPTLNGMRAVLAAESHSLEVFRNGHVEFSVTDPGYIIRAAGEVSRIQPWAVAEYTRNFVHLVEVLRERELIPDPYLIGLSLWSCTGCEMPDGYNDPFGTRERNSWTESRDIVLPVVTFPPGEPADATVKEITDRLWNAFHYKECPFFDAEGRFSIPAP